MADSSALVPLEDEGFLDALDEGDEGAAEDEDEREITKMMMRRRVVP